MPSFVEEVLKCIREVVPSDLADRANATTSVADLLDSFGRVRLVPVLEDRLGVRLEQADLAPAHWETVGTLATHLEWIGTGRRA